MRDPLLRTVRRLWQVPEWMRDANCAGTKTPDWWFPEKGGNTAVKETVRALAICEACAVKPECLAFALEGKEYGIWGGLTEQERKPRKKRGRPPRS